MANPSPIPSSPTLAKFLHLLQTKWTLEVACQNECDPPEACSCLLHIVHVEDVRAWWKRTVSETTKQTSLQRLLDELEPADHQVFPIKQKFFTGDYSCITVFSLLLKQGRHHLIQRFHDSGMNDRYLENIKPDSDQSLHHNLATVVSPDEIDKIIDDFQRERWAYCPLKLELHMDRVLQSTRVIPPFCRKVKLGEKGGTASIYWVTVQKNLISDEGLKSAILDSAYQDEKFGECYQMVLKSYSGKHQSAYELERMAFSGLQIDGSVPIVGYLGCYTHDYGEGLDAGKTYNLLLEWGERDLYEAWEDEKNVPPVRAREIIRMWKSLFEVADAIRHIHNLEVLRGKEKPLKFNGWHADIKPDNILLVRGRMKLADFGFCRFAPAVRSPHGSVPTELIDGFTDTYGAPEVSRKQSNGTLSGVTQSIDTWSFGCVLSVAATWIVLGFQGVRQYEALRQLSQANQIKGKTYDRFHNGFDVLPEIKQWHNFLRGHLRPSDTATSMVLDLVELKMLQTETRSRVNTEQLCKELKYLLRSADERINDLEPDSKDTDAIVLKALLEVEKTAEFQRSSGQTTNPLQQRLNATTGAAPLNPSQRASIQIQKEERRRSRRLGLTPYRREILQSELAHRSYVITEEDESSGKRYHRGDTTESPIQDTSLENPFSSPGTSYESSQVYGIADVRHGQNDRNTMSPNIVLAPPLRTPHIIQLPVDAPQEVGSPGGGHAMSFDWERAEISNATGDRTQVFRSVNQKNGAHSELSRYAKDPSASHKRKELAVEDPSGPSSAPASQSRYDDPSKSGDQAAEFTQIGGSQSHYDGTTHFGQFGHEVEAHRNGPGPISRDVPLIQTPVHSRQAGRANNNPADHFEPVHEMPQLPSPNIQVTHPLDPNAANPLANTTLEGLRIVHDPNHGIRDQYVHVTSTSFEKLPSEVLDLPYDICHQRKLLEQETPKGFRARVKNKFGWEDRKPDSGLASTLNGSRDLVLVIDNGATMFDHWSIARFVAETLAMKAAGLDRDGIDVFFTVDGDSHNRKGLVGDSGRQQLRAALVEAEPDYPDQEEYQTNMLEVIFKIAQGWKNKGKPATTLLVLTDGLWKSTNHKEFDKAIVKLAQDATEAATRRTGNRLFSIQFIRFGEKGYERLRYLDDDLCKNKVRDIVDHCSWRTSVDKIFKGSIEGYHDQNDNDEQDMKYCYSDLVALFKSYNDSNNVPERSSTLLSPTSPLVRNFSLSSNSLNREKYRSVPEPSAQTRGSHRKLLSQQF